MPPNVPHTATCAGENGCNAANSCSGCSAAGTSFHRPASDKPSAAGRKQQKATRSAKSHRPTDVPVASPTADPRKSVSGRIEPNFNCSTIRLNVHEHEVQNITVTARKGALLRARRTACNKTFSLAVLHCDTTGDRFRRQAGCSAVVALPFRYSRNADPARGEQGHRTISFHISINKPFARAQTPGKAPAVPVAPVWAGAPTQHVLDLEVLNSLHHTDTCSGT